MTKKDRNKSLKALVVKCSINEDLIGRLYSVDEILIDISR